MRNLTNVIPAKAGIPLLLTALLAASGAQAQTWQVQQTPAVSELRGLSVVSEQVAWASGAKGTVIRTVDGKSWEARPVPDAEKLDFRDIQAFDANTALIMGAGPGNASRIYRTTDGGKSWKQLFTNPDAEGFWDAMAFWDAKNGILFGDPVKGKFQVYVTKDGGEHWTLVPDAGLASFPDEGAFAASGTCLSVAGSKDAWFATGGAAKSRVFHSSDRGATWNWSIVPIAAAAPTKGIFSVGFKDGKTGLATGGDYKLATGEGVNGARSEDGGVTWTPAAVLPTGFMSVVVPVRGTKNGFVAAGLAGSGYSADAGKTWTVLDQTPVNTVGFASPRVGWAVGPKGLVMKYAGAPLAH